MNNGNRHGNRHGVAVMLVLAMAPMAFGQFAGTNDPQNVAGRTALENSTVGAVGLRAPGEMVTSGVARASMRIAHPRIGVDVQLTSEPPNAGDLFLTEAIQIIFGNLNLAINLFENAIRAQAGLPAVLPPLFPTDPTAPDDTTIPSEDDTTVVTDETGEPDLTGDDTGDETTTPVDDDSGRAGIRS